MTREEAIKYLIKPVATSTEIGEEKQKEFEAYNMAIEALKAEPSTEGRYEKAIKTLQEMPKYINSNTIGKKLEVLNYTKGSKDKETNEK